MKIINKIIAGCLIIAMALAGIVVAPVTADAADATAVDYDTTSGYKISDYWSQSKKTAPVKEGYVFGGWYKKDDNGNYVPLKQVDLTDDKVKDMTAYPKFVPAEVLSVKTQMGTKTTDDGIETSLRLLSTVDSTKYSEVGFEYQLGTKETATISIGKVYDGIKPHKDASDDEIMTASASFVENVSRYFIALDVINIADGNFNSIIYARPYWVTMDGTTVMGLARNNRVEDKQNDYISVPVNLLTDGANPTGVAAGIVEMTYNATKFDVVIDDSNNAKIDAGRLLPEMAYSITISDGIGTITFVGNATTAGTDVVADGLYANVRFQRKVEYESVSEEELNLIVEAKQFCDWKENLESVTTW